MSKTIRSHERDYIRWQNRSLRFYLGARLCYLNDLYSAAAFCSQQALESLVKGTLVYWDRSFDPRVANHKFAKMLRTLRNKVRKATGTEVPEYFYAEGRYQSTSRYPTEAAGIGIPSTFLDDLDAAFYDLVKLVPFQYNSELIHLLEAKDSRDRRVLTRRNRRSRRLATFLKIKRKPRPSAA